jgi:hypothetical protein
VYPCQGFLILSQNGQATGDFFSSLTTAAKSKALVTAPGNHDIWVLGNPNLWTPNDQLGNGFMQFYGQDVYASKSNAALPYDFSVQPKSRWDLPLASDFFFYNMIGNVAIIGFSGVHNYSQSVPMFEEACAWATAADPQVILIVGESTSLSLASYIHIQCIHRLFGC